MNRNPVTRAIAWLQQRPALTLVLVVLALVLLAVSWRWRLASTQLTVASITGQWARLPGPLDGTINCLLISEERTLYAGPVTLLHVPAILWPEPPPETTPDIGE